MQSNKKHIIVTAGATREFVDAVRFISNPSTGKMGIELAKAASKKGFIVDLIYANPVLQPPRNVKTYNAVTSHDLYNIIKRLIKKDSIIIMAAAVSDFIPEKLSSNKLKKNNKSINLKLKPNIDILSELGKKKKKGQILIGFAAETDDMLNNARKKLKNKNLDMIVANDISRIDSGFQADTNKAIIIHKNGSLKNLKLLKKSRLASIIIKDIIDSLI